MFVYVCFALCLSRVCVCGLTWERVYVWEEFWNVLLPSLVIYLLLCIVCDQEMVKTPVKTAGAPDTKKAFEALAAVNTLQDQVMWDNAFLLTLH